MDYKRIYDSLILKAQIRDTEDGAYYETHHIVPRCLGGSDSSDNLVQLTPEEHYLAHQLLVKIHLGHAGIIKAANAMSVDRYGHRVNNKRFGWLRRQFSEMMKAQVVPQERRERISMALTGRKRPEISEKLRQANLGRKQSQETRDRRSAAMKGRVFTEEHRAKISAALKGRKLSEEHMASFIAAGQAACRSTEANLKRSESMKGRIRTLEHQAKLTESQRGRVASAETRAKISAAKKGVKTGPQKNPRKKREMS